MDDDLIIKELRNEVELLQRQIEGYQKQNKELTQLLLKFYDNDKRTN